MLKLKIALVVVFAALTTACTTGPQVSSNAYSQGWRRAQVVAIEKDQLAVRSSKEDCRMALGAEAGKTRFAMASYSYGGNPNLRAKRIVAMSRWAIGLRSASPTAVWRLKNKLWKQRPLSHDILPSFLPEPAHP